MKPLNYLVVIFTALMLLACGPDKSPKPKLFEEQRNALDKAKEVEGIVQKQNQETQQSLEKNTQ